MDFLADLSQLDAAVDYIRDELKRKKIASREAVRASLIAEEVFRVMTECARDREDKISVFPKKLYSFALPLGCTITPGGSCMTLALSALFMARIFGIPAEAISIVRGLFSIVGMFLVTGNVTGLGAVTLIVAKKEKMLNMDIYNR